MPTLRNMVPVITTLGVVQISSFIDMTIVTYLPAGATTNLYYANTLALLPVSLFGVSVAAASLPEFSRDTGLSTMDALRERLRNGWQRILFYIVPSAVVFITLGDYCAGILYRGGLFGAADQRVVHVILAASALGLVSFASVKLLSSAYYALQDYRTPFRASVLSIFVSAAAAIAIAWTFRTSPYAAAGIALGSALGSYASFVVQLRGLHRRVGTFYTPQMWMGTRRIVIAAFIAALVGAALRYAQMRLLPAAHPRLTGIPILGAFGLTYLVAAWAMGSAEAARWLRRAPRGVERGR